MRTTFTPEQIEDLLQNPCVFNCTAKSVFYTYEFKKQALKLHSEGVFAREIWQRSGFDVGMWSSSYFRLTLRDWKRIVTKHGFEGLFKHGGLQYDRGPKETHTDKIRRLELQVQYLEAENRFLAQLRAKRAE